MRSARRSVRDAREYRFGNQIAGVIRGGVLEVWPFAPAFRRPAPGERFGAFRIQGIEAVTSPRGEPGYTFVGGEVLGNERVTVPAGTFDAVKVRFHGRVSNAYLHNNVLFAGSQDFTQTVWYAAAAKRAVKSVVDGRTFGEAYELESYKLR